MANFGSGIAAGLNTALEIYNRRKQEEALQQILRDVLAQRMTSPAQAGVPGIPAPSYSNDQGSLSLGMDIPGVEAKPAVYEEPTASDMYRTLANHPLARQLGPGGIEGMMKFVTGIAPKPEIESLKEERGQKVKEAQRVEAQRGIYAEKYRNAKTPDEKAAVLTEYNMMSGQNVSGVMAYNAAKVMSPEEVAKTQAETDKLRGDTTKMVAETNILVQKLIRDKALLPGEISKLSEQVNLLKANIEFFEYRKQELISEGNYRDARKMEIEVLTPARKALMDSQRAENYAQANKAQMEQAAASKFYDSEAEALASVEDSDVPYGAEMITNGPGAGRWRPKMKTPTLAEQMVGATQAAQPVDYKIMSEKELFKRSQKGDAKAYKEAKRRGMAK